MAARFDVAGRLADGLTAIDDVQTYVNASRMRGFVDGDLTLHSDQVRDWYQSEDGLDLHLLDSDCARLQAAAQAAEDRLRVLRSQAAVLTGAWQGGGGDAAAEFIGRHCAAGAQVAEAVRVAAEACGILRDELWRVVDRKVEATRAIDDQASSDRPAWLAAARAVSAGAAGDDDPSIAVVDTRVTPFVENTIRGEWLPVMRTSAGEAAAAYRAAVDAISAHTGARFEIPEDLGPRYVPPVGTESAPMVVPAGAAPAGVPATTRPPAAPAMDSLWPDFSDPAMADGLLPQTVNDAPAPMPPLPPNPLEALTSPASSALPTPPSGLGSLPGAATGALPEGGGIGGLAGQLADLLSGLVDPGGDSGALPEPPELPDDPLVDEPGGDEAGGEPGEEGETDEPVAEESIMDSGNADATASPEDECDGEPAAAEPEAAEPEAAETAPTPPPVEPLAESPPPPAPLAAQMPEEGATPCEIAADELPQAGE